VEEANMIAKVKCTEELKKLCQETELLEFSMAGSGIAKEVEYNQPVHATMVYRSMNPMSVEFKLSSLRDHSVTPAKVKQKCNDVYEIEYVELPKVRGRHKLEITAYGLPVPGSPFPVCVKISSPTQLGKPVKVIGGVESPIDIAINSAGELLIAEEDGGVIVINKRGKKVQSFQKMQYGFEKLHCISVDKDDNIYLIDQGCGKLFKFNQKFELIKVFDVENPCGIVVTKDQIIVGSSARGHKTCHVLDRKLNLEKTIAFKTIGVGDIDLVGIAVDEHMNLYTCDYENSCIHVISVKDQGELLYSFGQEQLESPLSICTSGGLVYI
jgi:hypothetical protein